MICRLSVDDRSRRTHDGQPYKHLGVCPLSRRTLRPLHADTSTQPYPKTTQYITDSDGTQESMLTTCWLYPSDLDVATTYYRVGIPRDYSSVYSFLRLQSGFGGRTSYYLSYSSSKRRQHFPKGWPRQGDAFGVSLRTRRIFLFVICFLQKAPTSTVLLIIAWVYTIRRASRWTKKMLNYSKKMLSSSKKMPNSSPAIKMKAVWMIPYWGGRRSARYVTPGLDFFAGRERQSRTKMMNGMEKKKGTVRFVSSIFPSEFPRGLLWGGRTP